MNNLRTVCFENNASLEIYENIVICKDEKGNMIDLTFAQQQVLKTLANRLNFPVSATNLYLSYSEDASEFSNPYYLKLISDLKGTLPKVIRKYVKSARGVGYKLVGTIKTCDAPIVLGDRDSTISDTISKTKNTLGKGCTSSLIKNGDNKFLHAVDFIKSCVNCGKEIDNICMTFHSGWDWVKGDEKGQYLRELDNLGISIRVIVNHRDAIRKIAKTMSDPQMEEFYLGFNEGIKKWYKCTCTRKHLELRISDYPIFRKIYIVNYKDGTTEALMRDYAYNYATEYDYGKILLTNNDLSLNIFRREFEFLWDQGFTYEQWLQKLPKHEELLIPEKYILLNLSPKKDDNTSQISNNAFIISTLQIGENNDIKLEVNSAYGTISEIIYTKPERILHGTAKVTGNNIYITASDLTETEIVTLTIRKPLHDKKRLLGIMTDVDEHAQPVAYKIACITPQILRDIDVEQLIKILMQGNENREIRAINLDERDIDVFYSNNIFLREFSQR